MFYGYTEIDIRVFSRLMVMIGVFVATVRKFVNQGLTWILGNTFFLKSSY